MKQYIEIKTKINECLDNGMTDKYKIYDVVVESLHVPRATVRKVCRELLQDMQRKVAILEPYASKVGVPA